MLLKKDKIRAIAIGGFDGIHRGHKELIKKLGKNGALLVIERSDANLTPMQERSKYSKYPCKFYRFEEIKDLSGKEFLALIKTNFPNLEKIIVGYDFTFGRYKSHNSNDLKIMFDGDVEIVEEYRYDGISVHSSVIRQLIKEGQIGKANELLGREYSIVGKVIKGQGLGKKELYATLNLSVEHYVIPKNGVYATRTFVNGKFYNSISFVGIRHSTDEKFAIETHILDEYQVQNEDTIELTFVAYLRENEKFHSLEKLKKQIAKDIKEAKKYLLTCNVGFIEEI
ncbi:MAG: bifunctional riboflavin kinase/FAD synthetase [Campylobacteraceae bacterium]|nr:bifunctional riboflavin kinase/FAD synthetase [Campylobacteraceae bacterium]